MNEQQEYYAVPVIPVDGSIHNESGFCGDMRHACPENAERITEPNQAIPSWIATADASRIFRGQTV